jgi:RsiW-degrading membrane proteinase PrsW (M82 family)
MNGSLIQDPVTFIVALIAGTVPSILWLWFWIKEDDIRKPPLGLIGLTFIMGMLMVIAVVPLEKFMQNFTDDQTTLIVLWAACEEILKYSAFALIAYVSNYCEEPIDYPIYAMTAALGFAALENTMYLVRPVGLQDATVALLTSNLRFLGSTLLHSVTTGFIGLMVGLSFYQNKVIRFGSLIVGFILAIGLHAVFNFFIMKNNGENFLQVFAVLWVASIISILVFEKVRRMSPSSYVEEDIRTTNSKTAFS